MEPTHRQRHPPQLAWFLAAWALCVLALFLPAVGNKSDIQGSQSGQGIPGYMCLGFGWVYLWKSLTHPGLCDGETFYLGALVLPNFMMLASPILAFNMPRRSRPYLGACVASAAMTVLAASFLVYAAFSHHSSALPGSFVWIASSVILTIAFHRASREARTELPQA